LPQGLPVSIQPHTTDRYGRTVAEVNSDININLVMVEDGQTFAYRLYLSGCDAKECPAAPLRHVPVAKRAAFTAACGHRCQHWEVPHLQINQGTLQLRVAAVVALLTHGCHRHDVLNLSVNDWGISVRSADRLLRLDWEEIKTDWQIERSDLLAQLFSNLSELQHQARQSGQLGIALACINANAHLADLGACCT
jgi:hypothetical protein